jgi:hypothetical protein
VPHCGVKISSGGKSINARFCVSDEAFMFYADKVAEFFGLTKPTRVMMTYIIDENTFFLDALGDAGTEESSNENEIIDLTSYGDESESDSDESQDQLNESQNQQMIVVCQHIYFELFHLIMYLDFWIHIYFKLDMNIPPISLISSNLYDCSLFFAILCEFKYNEEINAQYETFHTVTWSKTVTESMVAYRSKQSLVINFKLICILLSYFTFMYL